MINAAMVGLGSWAEALAQSVHDASQKIRIGSCYSPSQESRMRFAARFGAAPVESLEEILEDSEIDAVLIASPHSTHLELIGRAAAKRKHVFCEKPLALTYADALAAAARCQAAGVVLAVGHNKRLSPVAARIKTMIEAGELGTPMHFESNFSFPGAQVFAQNRWRADRAENPGGGLASCGVHAFDLAAWLLGPIRRVAAIVRSRSGLSNLDDIAAILLDFESGATGYIGCLYASPYTFFANVYGTEGSVHAEPEASSIRVHRPPIDELVLQSLSVETADTLRIELEAFAEACVGGEAFPITPAEAAHSVAVMEAVVRSGRENGLMVDVARSTSP